MGRETLARVAVLVDAAYLHEAASRAVHGERRSRSESPLDITCCLALLRTNAEQVTGAELLRFHWYDACNGQPSDAQNEIASQDRVKLRLGTLSGGKQKGVDSLIQTDLATYARNRAVTDVVLVTGDGDFVPAITDAQMQGVAVHVLAAEAGIDGAELSQDLAREADTVTRIPRVALRLLVIGAAELDSPPSTEHVVPLRAGDADDVADPRFDTVVAQVLDTLAVEVIRKILAKQDPGTLPHETDRQLLRAGHQSVNRELSGAEKRYLRHEFHDAAAALLAQLDRPRVQAG